MAAWSYRALSETPPALQLGPEIGADLKCLLPRPDYYIHQDSGLGNDADPYDLANGGPIARCIVENTNKIHVERNLYSHMLRDYKKKDKETTSTSLDTYQDYHPSEDAEHNNILTFKPPAFIVFGKPGIGSTTIAKKIVEHMNCVLINPDTVTQYYRQNVVPEVVVPGQLKLCETTNPPDSMLLSLIQSRMLEKDVLSRGYVLEGIPRLNADTKTDYMYQAEVLAKLNPKPEYIIVLHMQNVDLFKRRSEQKVDIQDGRKYTLGQYTNKKIEPLEPEDHTIVHYHHTEWIRKQSKFLGTDAEAAGLSSMIHTQSKFDPLSNNTRKMRNRYVRFVPSHLRNRYFDASVEAIPSEVLLRLGTSEDDSPQNIHRSFERYRQWLPHLQAFIDKFDVRKVFELNAYWTQQIMMKMVVEFIDWNRVPPQELPTPPIPLYIIVTGPPKSGKSLLAQNLAHKFNLMYIAADTMMDEIIKHSFLNKITEEYDLTSKKLSSGPQSMLMADEILAYLRAGYAVPAYMFCRILDLAFMAPRAQFHGAVFDNYPLDPSQLQELLQRGVIPSLVVNLQLDLSGSISRSERQGFDPEFNYDTLLEDNSALVQYLYEENQTLQAPLLDWYENEGQCLLNINAIENPRSIFEKVIGQCYEIMGKLQRYIRHFQDGKPCILDGTTPLTSILQSKLSREFGMYDPVAINEEFELLLAENLKDLSKVVEYRNEVYVFASDQHVEMFILNPDKYTAPTCEYVPPEVVPSPCLLSLDEMNALEPYWGFNDFDPVHYYEGNYRYNWLQRGESKYCAEYDGKLYFFMNHENLNKFLRKPYLYTEMTFPTKFPRRRLLLEEKTEKNRLDTLSPAGYLIATGLSQELCKMLSMMAKKRPQFPLMTPAQSAQLYLGCYLKALSTKSPPEVQAHYRETMERMTKTQSVVEELCAELNQSTEKRKTIPVEKLSLLMTQMKLAEKYIDTLCIIDGPRLSYETALRASESISGTNNKDSEGDTPSAAAGGEKVTTMAEEASVSEGISATTKFDMEHILV